ncbi:MAG TPA: hypothetical protein VD903_11935 [Pseudonocardia sp.]|nr:hypothetical protein [Pseudonocardia sp.]
MSETKADLEKRVAQLEKENADLREQAGPSNADARERSAKAPQLPSFKISEGERNDLQRQGWAISPFTGQWYTASEAGIETLEGVDPNPPRPRTGVSTGGTPAAERAETPSAPDGVGEDPGLQE